MKRLVSMLLSVIMVISFLPFNILTVSATTTLEIGDYVQIGSYYGEPILWRCVSFEKIKGYDTNGNPIMDATDTTTEYKEGYLPLMLSDKIICNKPFDANGASTGSHARDRYGYRKIGGSNYWRDSNIRTWLNSSESQGNINWLCGNQPDNSHVYNGINDYANEKGFLSNFSSKELNAIKTVSQKCLLNYEEYENGLSNFGDNSYAYMLFPDNTEVENYNSAYSELVSDKIFLLDIKQVTNLRKNKICLGEEYDIGKLSKSAVLSTEESLNDMENEQWSYWLRTPQTVDSTYYISNHINGSDYVYAVWMDGRIGSVGSFGNPAYESNGIRPAFFLDMNSISFHEGNGAISDPYKIKQIKVVLNGEEIEFDQTPINTPEGRLLVPIRKIAESMDKIVLYSEETKTAFIDNSDNALIIPLFEKTMYLANENGFSSWEKVELDVPAIETNGRTLVPVRAFCESLGATVIWEDETKTAFITYDDSIVSERMNDMLFDSINLVWYMERLDALWSTKEFPFDDYSVVIDDFYINRPYGVDAINMGLSDPFAGIQDLISMTNGSDNATNIILQSMQEILSEVPNGTDLNFDAGIVKTLKEMVASGVDIYLEVGGLGYKLRSYSDAFVFLDDALLDYSKNYHSTVSGIFDLSVFTLEELAYLLTEYQTNVEYLDIFENKLKEAGYSDETIEKSVSLLRTQYTNKFIGVMLDLRSACVEASVGAVLNAGLTIAGQSTWGVGVGMLVWKGIFGITGINKQGEALKTFYGLYCIDNRLNSTFNDVISVHESLTSSELLELRRLVELLKAEKITAYKAMKNITWDKDSKNEADKQIEEIQRFTYRIFK